MVCCWCAVDAHIATFYKDTVRMERGPTLPQDDLMLVITPAVTLFQIRSRSQISWPELEHELGEMGHNSTHNSLTFLSKAFFFLIKNMEEKKVMKCSITKGGGMSEGYRSQPEIAPNGQNWDKKTNNIALGCHPKSSYIIKALYAKCPLGSSTGRPGV